MDEVEHVRERVVHRLGGQSELAQESVLGYSVRLSHNKIVSVWVQVEGILEEVDRSAVHGSFHAEQSDSEGVLGLLRRVWDRSQIHDLLTDALNLALVGVLAVLFKLREQVELLQERLTNGLKSTVLIVESIELGHVELNEESVVSGHSIDGIQQVMNAGKVEKDLHWLGGFHLLQELFLFSLPVLIFLLLLVELFDSQLLLQFLFTLRVTAFGAVAPLHLEDHLGLPLLFSLRRHTLTVAFFVVYVTEAEQEGAHVL